VILTVAHGHFFIAAYLAAKFTSVPYILVVHDDWVSFTKYDSLFLRFVASAVFKPIARSAAHVYAVSAEMAELLATRDGVKAEVQLPATELPPDGQGGRSMEQGQLRILYAGNIYITMEDALELLVSVVQSEEAEQQHLNCSVHIYANQTVPPEWVSRGHVVCHGWVGQKELQQALSEADVLFLPFSFREEMRFCTEHAFPSKAADYLAAAKPLLVCGPPCSTIVRYARATGIGEVVDAADRVLMLNALVRLNSADHRAELGRHAFVAFERNHDIKKQRQNFNRLLASLAQID
jgi:glycosyltransferase involved in cell wall biosynthesis